MANEIRSTSLGSYVEREGLQSSIVTDYGIYVESVEFNNEVDLTIYGAYIETEGESIQLSSFGSYIEYHIPTLINNIFLGGKFLDSITSFTVKIDVRSVSGFTLSSQYKIPIIPDFIVTVNGLFSKNIIDKLGDLNNQSDKKLLILITDRFNEQVILYNDFCFVSRFTIDINIDQAIIYSIDIVGSGTLNTYE